MLDRRQLLLTAGAALVPLQAHAAYPDKPLVFVLPNPAGSPLHAITLMVVEKLGKELGKRIVVENIPGADGIIGTAKFLHETRDDPDGYRLLIGFAGSLAIAPAMPNRDVTYNPLEDFLPLHGIAGILLTAITPAAAPFKSIEDLVENARNMPEGWYGCLSTNATLRAPQKLLEKVAGVKFRDIPYGRAPETQVIADMISLWNESKAPIGLTFGSVGVAIPLAKEGRVRILAATNVRTPTLTSLLPGIRTFGEIYKDWTPTEGWLHLFGPKGMPEERARIIERAMARVMQDQEVLNLLTATGMYPMALSSEKLGEELEMQVKKWRRIVKDTGITN